MWAKEEIPNTDGVYMRVHRNLIPDGQVRPNVFREHGKGMSVDWNKYSTPLETRNRGRIPPDNVVISMGVDSIRAIEELTVEHAPVQENTFDQEGSPIAPNRAHTDVLGISSSSDEKKTEIRVKLSRIWNWEIRFE